MLQAITTPLLFGVCQMWNNRPKHAHRVKPIVWVASALDDLRRLPAPVRQSMGFALFQAQIGGKHVHAKPLQGFGGIGVMEVVEDFDGNTYRAMYTIRFSEAIYVLHAFQKKSARGTRTPKREMDVVRARLEIARRLHDRAVDKEGTE